MGEKKVYRAIGLMSGTSCDGVDAALIETDGFDFVRPLGFVFLPYEAAERERIRAAFGKQDRDNPAVRAAEDIITKKHIAAAHLILHNAKEGGGKKQSGHGDEDAEALVPVDVIGFHGQTTYHAPDEGVTVQIGDAALMAAETGIDVVDDFRIKDVKAGGEGAPLLPLYHRALVRRSGSALPVAILNIGGVGNVTWIGSGPEDILAFDTGPGNALMDDWVQKRLGKAYDENGALAASGQVIEAMVERWMSHAYFAQVPPKSLDRDEWDIADFGQLPQGMDAVSDADGAASLMAFTGRSIVEAVKFMPEAPKAWYVCGGGRHNKALMGQLGEALEGDVHDVSALGWNGDATEAEGFAYLAVRSLLGEPLSLPSTTGVPEAVTGGRLTKAGGRA